MTEHAGEGVDARQVLVADARSGKSFIDKRLLRFCEARAASRQDAEDAAQAAIVRALAGEGWHRWQYDGKRPAAESLLMHLCDLAKDVLAKKRKRASSRNEGPPDSSPDAEAADPHPTPSRMLAAMAAQQDGERRVKLVLDRLDEETREMLRVESETDQELSADEVAEKLGWPTRRVYRAREKVRYHAEVVMNQERARRVREGSAA